MEWQPIEKLPKRRPRLLAFYYPPRDGELVALEGTVQMEGPLWGMRAASNFCILPAPPEPKP